MAIGEKELRQVLNCWRMDLKQLRSDIDIQGSPERCLFRTVAEAQEGGLFLLEQLLPHTTERKAVIAQHLSRLGRANFPVAAYRQGCNGKTIQFWNNRYWQLSPYVQGMVLNRETYWREAWRGRELARFLIALHHGTKFWPVQEPVFSLPEYIHGLLETIREQAPGLMPGLQPASDFLERTLYPVYTSLPVSFSHGDPHPLNTIWGEDRILCVIDWEFCGWKPLLYDAALVAGCIGSEAPEAAGEAFVTAFVGTLERERVFREQLALLPVFTLALRFAWLSEWLRRSDTAMIDFELFYMQRLLAACRQNGDGRPAAM